MKLFLVILSTLFILNGCSSSSNPANKVTVKGSGATGSLSVVDPTTMKVKLYELWVSSNADCSGTFTQVYDDDDAEYQNMLEGPTFGSGELADGTYNCVAMVISDNIQFIPETTEGNCASGTTYTLDVCRSGEGEMGGEGNITSSKLPNGTEVSCTGSFSGGTQTLGDDKVAVYLSTSGTDDGQAFVPTSPLSLASAFVKAGAAQVTFIVDGTGKVESNGSQCDMQPPTFGFTSANATALSR